MLDNKEAFYGGAAGGGKSEALLMGGLQYVGNPDYSGLILRRTYKDLALPGAIMDRSQEWLAGTDARWDGQNYTWRFPKGSTLTFGYLENENDKFRYQGSEFQYIGFDEMTQFTSTQYRYLFSRLRRLLGSNVPVRMRGAGNPGGVGHVWTKQRFIIEGESQGRPFIPAKIQDNPYLDAEAYIEALSELDPITRAQLLSGNWDALAVGDFFVRAWFEERIVDRSEVPSDAKYVRYWDLAATEAKPGKKPDWTSGTLIAEKAGRYWICDIQRFQKNPQGTEEHIKKTAELDGKGVTIWMEQEPGSSGVITIDHYARYILKGYSYYGNKVTGDKALRAKPLSSAAQKGNVYLVRGLWINTFLDEAELFGTDSCENDDQVDSTSGAFDKVNHVMPKVAAIVIPNTSTWR